ncbi:MAG: hypothetical protein HQM10_23815 [Candidatus Riflebacteria bacterium]|nr:hypothetical protein [Candidatus Riflebacteria bacterium]
MKRKLLPSVLIMLFVLASSGNLLARAPVTNVTDPKEVADKDLLVGSTVSMGSEFPVTVNGETFVFGIPAKVVTNEMGFLLTGNGQKVSVAKPCDPNGLFARKIIPYLLASKPMQDSLKMRKMGRQTKYQVFKEVMAKNTNLSAEKKDAILRFLALSVKSPLVVLDRAPSPEFIRAPGAGPCMMPVGIIVMDAQDKPLTLETSVLCVTDLGKEGQKPIFSISDAVDNDTLDLVLCHENAHAVMFDMYGASYFKIKRISNNGHDTPYITDQAMAFIEGWAEAFEAVYGPTTIQFAEKDRKKYNISQFLYDRQDPIRRENYIWASVKGKKTGILKNPLQMMSTEGVIAGQLYDILTSRAISAPLEKCLNVMFLTQPHSYQAFIRSFLKMFPEDRKVITRIVLEGTKYATVNSDAPKLYHAYYQAKAGLVTKKVQKADFEKAKANYNVFKENLFKQFSQTGDLFANVPPDVWFTGVWISDKPKEESELTKIEIARKEARKQLGIPEGQNDPNRWDFNLNLNTISKRLLMFIGLTDADAQKVITERVNRGGFKGDASAILSEILTPAVFTPWMNKMQIKSLSNEEKAGENTLRQVKTLFPEDMERLCPSGN